jgi:hypothetical protein
MKFVEPGVAHPRSEKKNGKRFQGKTKWFKGVSD